MNGTNENVRVASAEVSPKRKVSASTDTAHTPAKKAKSDTPQAEDLGNLGPCQLKRLQEVFPVTIPPRDHLGRRGGISGPSGG
jgi:hypothetical protein